MGKITNLNLMNMIRNVFSTIANILAVVGFFLSLFIAFRVFPNNDNTNFDYQGVLVGIMAAIFTMLVGWNIFQALDLKNNISIVEDLRIEMGKQLNELKEQTEFNQALTNASLCQYISASFAPNGSKYKKGHMIIRGLEAIKIASQIPNGKKQIYKIVKSLNEGMEYSSEISFSDAELTNLIMKCGEIQNPKEIEGFEDFINQLKRCRVPNDNK